MIDCSRKKILLSRPTFSEQSKHSNSSAFPTSAKWKSKQTSKNSNKKSEKSEKSEKGERYRTSKVVESDPSGVSGGSSWVSGDSNTSGAAKTTVDGGEGLRAFGFKILAE